MSTSAAVTALRKRHIWLEALPDTISVQALEARQRPATVKAIEVAPLDDIAFAMLGVEAEFNAIGDRLHALRKFYTLARKAGGLGVDIAIDVVSEGGR